MRFRYYRTSAFSSAQYHTPASVAIIRNDPAEVIIRITGYPAASGSTSATYGTPPSFIDCRLRRGSPVVDFYWSSPNSTAAIGIPGNIDWSPVPSWTSGASGQYGVTDGSGNALVQITPSGADSNSSATNWSTAVGFFPGGTSPLSFAIMKNNYYAPSSERVRLVGA
jgi:hypothetical protein